MNYGYARISTPQQSLDAQCRSIHAIAPDAKIYKEAYTGMTMERPEWLKLLKRVKAGDTIYFHSVSRLSRNAEEGYSTYFDLFDKGINLVFITEPYINTDVYSHNLKNKIGLTGTDEDELITGINNYFRKLAARQIRIAFEQSQKEHDDLVERTKGGILTARINGKQIGRPAGTGGETQKAQKTKEAILKYSKDFNGVLSDVDVIKLTDVSRNSYYKYKRELLRDQC